MKKIILLIFLIFVINTSSKIEASFNVDFRIDWINTYVEIPLGENFDKYKDSYELKVYIDNRELNKDEYYVHLGINGTSTTTINTYKVGKYRIDAIVGVASYSATSEATITYSVIDSESPQISIENNNITTLYGVKPDYEMLIKASDNSGDILNVYVNDRKVDYNFVGTYDATANVRDNSGNSSEIELKVHVVDFLAPRITLLKPLYFSLGDEIKIDDHFYGYDDYDKVITNRIRVEGYDKNKAGDQTIYAILEDTAGNEVRMSFKATVIDNNAPMIYFKTNIFKIDVKSDLTYDLFFDMISRVEDDGNVIDHSEIQIDYSNVLNELGTYQVIYKISDFEENECEMKINMEVVQFDGPEIECQNITLKKGDNFNISLIKDYIKVNDPYDPNAYNTLRVDFTSVNLAKPGIYMVMVSACNSSGIFTHDTLLITVQDDGFKKALQYWPLSLLVIAPIGYIGYKKYKKYQLKKFDIE